MLSFSVADYITRHYDLSILAKQMSSLGDPTMQVAFDDMDVCWADAVKNLSPIQAFIIDRTWNGNFNDDAIGLECGKSVSWVKHTRHDSFEILDQYYRDRLQLDLMPFARKKRGG